MTFEQIRAIVTGRMTQWAGIPADAVDYPNNLQGPFDPAGKPIWARLADVPGLSSAPEIGIGPCVRRSGLIIVQLFVPTYKGTLLLTRAADTLREHFEFYSDPVLPFECFAVSQAVPGDDGHGWYQANLTIPYRAG
ncbi:TPA: phage tail terminator-like protein [Pseudomonas aeruginosa]